MYSTVRNVYSHTIVYTLIFSYWLKAIMSNLNFLGSSDTITGLFSSELANMSTKTCSCN